MKSSRSSPGPVPLAQAGGAGQAEQEAAAEQRAATDAGRRGTDLVPLLAARQEEVDAALEEMFAATGLTQSRAVRATDAEGWASGRAAADLASLRSRTQVED